MVSAGKDMMAAYVRQLLEQDESRRRLTLESLSNYHLKDGSAEQGTQPQIPNSATPEQYVAASQMPRKVLLSSALSSEQADPKFEPAMIELPPGLCMPNMPNRAMDAKLRAAEANHNLSLSRVQTPPVAQMQPRKESSPDRNKGMGQLDRVEEKPQPVPGPGRLVSILEKALSDLSNSLSPEAAIEAQKALAMVVEQAKRPQSQGNYQDMEALKWLPQYLEKQQEASVLKLIKLMGANGPKNMGQYPAGIVPGQPLPPPGIGAPAAAAPNRPLAWGHVDSMMGMQAGNSYMPPMRGGGCPQWWGAAQSQMGAQAPPSPSRAVPSPMVAKRQVASKGMQGEMHPKSPAAGNTTDGSALQQTGETLRMHLRSLIKIDSARILIVRKINRLGFASPELLEQHYSWFGHVERVLVAHSRVKSSAYQGMGANKLNSRLRPSGLGFLVMSKIEEAEAILAAGSEHIVCGALIRVQQFERRMTELGDEGDEDLAETGFAEENLSV